MRQLFGLQEPLCTFGDQQIDFHWRKLEFQGRLTGEGGHVGRAFCLRGKFEDADSGRCRVENALEGAEAAAGSGKHGVLICATRVSMEKDEQGQTKGSGALLGQLRLCPLDTEGHLLFCSSVTTCPAFTEMPWLLSAAPLRAELGLRYLIASYD